MSDDEPAVPTDREVEAGENRECFVIAPIGDDGTETRRRTENLYEHAIQPVVADFGLEAVVAHKISEPGNIPKQVVRLLFEAKLVIADLTNHNGNVMYELAVRHATGKPVVKIAQEGHTPPFDIGAQRTKFYRADFGGAEEFRGKLRSAVREALNPDHDPENPIQATRKDFTLRKVLEENTDSLSGENKGELVGVLRQLVDRIETLESTVERPTPQQGQSETEYGALQDLIGRSIKRSKLGSPHVAPPTGPGAPTASPFSQTPSTGEVDLELEQVESPFDSLEKTAELVRRLRSEPSISDGSFSEDDKGQIRLKVFYDSTLGQSQFKQILDSKVREIKN